MSKDEEWLNRAATFHDGERSGRPLISPLAVDASGVTARLASTTAARRKARKAQAQAPRR
jgi:acetylglutamate kinase